MFTTMESRVDSGRYATNSQSIQFGPWSISYDVSCILPSVCSTKVVCERDDDQFCQFCVYSKELSIPHFPDMVFPKNILKLSHENGSTINFNPLDALKCIKSSVQAIEVSCAEAWQEARPDAGKMKKSFDWTFSTDYKGTLSDNILVEPTDEQINFELLKKKDQILFYHDLTLFEDELHDHGISKMSVKIRVMPTHWFVLLRFFLRVDDVFVKSYETRMFHMINTNYVVREITSKEAEAKDLNNISATYECKETSTGNIEIKNMDSYSSNLITLGLGVQDTGMRLWRDAQKIPTSQMKEADDVIPFLPVKEKLTHKLIIIDAESKS